MKRSQRSNKPKPRQLRKQQRRADKQRDAWVHFVRTTYPENEWAGMLDDDEIKCIDTGKDWG